jgi:hypothetical protein
LDEILLKDQHCYFFDTELLKYSIRGTRDYFIFTNTPTHLLTYSPTHLLTNNPLTHLHYPAISLLDSVPLPKKAKYNVPSIPNPVARNRFSSGETFHNTPPKNPAKATIPSRMK